MTIFDVFTNVVVYIPNQYLPGPIPSNDWENDFTYCAGGWCMTEAYCESHNPMSVEDWLSYYTYTDDEGRHIYNGKQDLPTHLMDKYSTDSFKAQQRSEN